MKTKKARYLVGIDEAGRGPLAGPVAVGAVMSRHRLDRLLRSNLGAERFDLGFELLRDSKKLSVKKREQWFTWLKRKQKNNQLKFTVSLVGEKIIDKIGIVRAVAIGVKRCLERFDLEPNQCRILLDGSLQAPQKFRNQKTIIRGDEKIPLIMLASIVAKVRRDRRMIKLARVYPNYNFEIHKGYGTRAHYRALRRYGLSPFHRRSFLKNYTTR